MKSGCGILIYSAWQNKKNNKKKKKKMVNIQDFSSPLNQFYK